MIILYKVARAPLWFVRVGDGPGVYTDTKARALDIISLNFVLTVPTISAECFLCQYQA